MITIVIPFGKGIGYLNECLGSIARQQYKNIETVLVVDSKATDPMENIESVREEYDNKINLKIVIMEDKTGVAAARNKGILEANGEFIYFLDADDYMIEDTLSKLMDKMTSETELVYGRIMHTWFKPSAFNVEQGDKVEPDDDSDKEEENLAAVNRLEKFDDIHINRLEALKKIEDITALGVLYRKRFLITNKIEFDETQRYYPDAEFWLKVLFSVNRYESNVESVYVKRYHNDKIHLPSLTQVNDDTRIAHFVRAYETAIDMSDNKARKNLENMLCQYVIGKYSKKFHKDKFAAKQEFPALTRLLNKCKMTEFKNYGILGARILKSIAEGDMAKAEKYSKLKMVKTKIFTMFSSKTHFYRTINLYIFQKLSLKNNWILFESFVGRNYAGQPKYIYKYLSENYGNKYRYIWIVDKAEMLIDGEHKEVKRFSLMYYYYMSRSKYWVNNMRQPVWFPKRKNQIMLSTWHGTPLKKLVFDMDDVHSSNPKYKDIVYRQTRVWDYLLSDNPFSTEVFQSCFIFDKDKILEYGYPANDPMYYPNRDELSGKIKARLGIPKDKRVILYAPTWRDDKFYEAGHYKFEMAMDIERLQKEFGHNSVILLRMHYWVVDNIDIDRYKGFVYDVSKYDDITDLYLISNICITDYSSVFFDFANTRRPILFFTYDLEKYRDVLRGFYLDVEKDLPGPLLLTNDELVYAISNIEKVTKDYKDKYEEFYNKFCCRDDGNASKRVVEKVFGENK